MRSEFFKETQLNMKLKLYKIALFVFFILSNYSVAAGKTIEIPLYKIAPVGVTDLKCSNADIEIKIPIPERWDVKSAVLDFSYVNSSALIARNSRLVVELNKNPLAQIVLNPLAPEGDAKILLPSELLEPGYNNLVFEVFQHHTLECENPCAPELWTTLMLDKASIEIEYELKEIPLKLSSISDFIFDPKIFPQGTVNIVTEDRSEKMSQIVSTVTSGIALRYDYRKVLFSSSRKIKPGVDNIVIGSKEFIEKTVGREVVKTHGPGLQIMHFPKEVTNSGVREDKTKALLIVSGDNLEQIKMAADAIAILSFPFPGTNIMEVNKVSLPKVHPYTGKLIINPGNEYSFKTLNFDNYTFEGLDPDKKEIVFRLPTDLLIEPNRVAVLSLHMVYGAGMRSDSVLNVLLNDKFINAIHLDNPNGTSFSGYKIQIPTYLFKRGKNVITFQSVLTPSITGHCEIIQTNNLFLSIFDDSWFEFPSMSHWVDLPRMELFFEDGFPFTRWPDGRNTTLYLTSNDDKTFASALNIIGLISQKIGYPLFNLNIDLKEPKTWNGDIIVVGDIQSIPNELKKNAPIKYTKLVSAPYPLLKDLRTENSPNSRWKKILMDFLFGSKDSAFASPDEADTAYTDQSGGMAENQGIMMEFESPYRTGRSVLMLTANSRSDLLELSHSAWDSSVQSKSMGSLTLVDFSGKDYNAWSQKTGSTYFSGSMGKAGRVKSLINASKWNFFGLLAASLFVLTICIFYSLKKFRKRRFG